MFQTVIKDYKDSIHRRIDQMQQQLQEIIRRFEQNYYQAQYQNKDIVKYYDDEDHHQFCNQEIIKLKNKAILMEETIESLVYYGNRTHRFYQSVINETIVNFNEVKQEKNQKQTLFDMEIKEARKTIQQLGQEIDILKNQILKKQEYYKDVSEKYQLLIERAIEANQEYQKHIRDIQENFKHEMDNAKALIESKDYLLLQCTQQNKRVLRQNFEIKDEHKLLKIENQNLTKENMALLKEKEATLSQNQLINQKLKSLQEKIDDMLWLNQQGCDDHKYLRCQERSNTFKTNKSRDTIHQEKDNLNISEHYIQSIKSFQIKYGQSQEHIDQIIVKRSQFAKHSRFQTAFINLQCQNVKRQIKISKPYIQIQEPKAPAIPDPYQSFFTLLVQSQKLNSSHFNKVASLNLNHLYDDLRNKLIPFNKWQTQIKNYLQFKQYQQSR